MALDLTTPFVWGAGGARMTPEEIAQQRKVAESLLASGMDYSPVKSPWQGAARVAQAVLGGLESREAGDASKRNASESGDYIAKMLAAAQGGASPAATTDAAPAAPIASGAAVPAGQTTIPSGSIDPRLSAAISSAAGTSGVDPAYMTRLALVENGGKVEGGSPLSSATGPFQFLNSTAKQYGLTNPNDPAAAADAAARLTLDNKAALTQALGREPTLGELYLAHQQGAGGAAKLLANPNAPVEQVIGQAAAANNGATPGMTAGQFASKWTNKFADLGQPQVVDANAASPLDTAQYPAGPVGAPTAIAGNAGGVPVVNGDQSSPLDTAMYPAGPVGAPMMAASGAADGIDPAALPVNAQPTQGTLPAAQAVQAASAAPTPARPAINPVVLQALTSPYVDQQTKAIAGMLFKSQMDAQAKAADPLRALQIQKAQQDLNKSDWDWKPYGRDANGNWSYAWVNPKTQEIRDRNGQPIQQNPQQPADDPTAGLNGEDYLKAIPRDRADIARKVAAGEIDVTSLPNRGNYRMQVLSDAARFDPTFNPADYKTRLATRKDFTSGKSAQNITSFNTAIGHLGSLDESIDKLGNRGSSWYNAATAPISEQTDPKYQVALKDFRTSKQAVIDELTRAFRGSGGNVHDLVEWEKTINEAESPVALHAATHRAIELLRSRIDAVGDQYNRGMGKTTDPVQLLSPKARSTLERLEGGGQTDQGGGRKTSTGISWSIE